MTAIGQAGTALTSLDALREKARILRIHSMRMTTAAGSGHPTSCLSAAELMAATFFHAMKFDPANPNALASDRFVLSKGHAAPILYAALAEAGRLPGFAADDAAAILERTRRPSDAAHSRRGRGHRLAGPGAFGRRRTGDGRARSEIAGAHLRADGRRRNGRRQRVGSGGVRRALRDRQSDGDWPTSMRWARASAPCIATIRKSTGANSSRRAGPPKSWTATTWRRWSPRSITRAPRRGKPYAIIARTEKGHGVSFLADKDGWHGKALSPEQLEKALAEMGSPIPPIVKDDGHSYARKSLPVPPDFPRRPPPDYTIGQMVATREAYGTGLKNLAAVNPKVYAVDGDVKNSTFSGHAAEGVSRPAHPGLHRRAKSW